MLAIPTNLTIKPATDKTSGHKLTLTGGVSENILPEGKDGASDPRKQGRVTLQIEGTTVPVSFDCTMKARYKLGANGTEITWACAPDDPFTVELMRLFAGWVCAEQPLIVSFKERGK